MRICHAVLCNWACGGKVEMASSSQGCRVTSLRTRLSTRSVRHNGGGLLLLVVSSACHALSHDRSCSCHSASLELALCLCMTGVMLVVWYLCYSVQLISSIDAEVLMNTMCDI